jgi:hypothetical protein
MLTIKNDTIANTLFDQRKIESILLLPDRVVGREVIEKNSTNNCFEAFLPTGDQLIGKPSFRAYACSFKNPTYFIQNPEAAIQ